jgi:beta-galactosidase
MADRRDVVHIVAEIQDDQGRLVPVADNEITFELQGEARIIGVDNGKPQSHEDFKAKHRNAFNGLCLAIVQSGATAGPVKIRASSPGLAADALTLSVS